MIALDSISVWETILSLYQVDGKWSIYQYPANSLSKRRTGSFKASYRVRAWMVVHVLLYLNVCMNTISYEFKCMWDDDGVCGMTKNEKSLHLIKTPTFISRNLPDLFINSMKSWPEKMRGKEGYDEIALVFCVLRFILTEASTRLEGILDFSIIHPIICLTTLCSFPQHTIIPASGDILHNCTSLSLVEGSCPSGTRVSDFIQAEPRCCWERQCKIAAAIEISRRLSQRGLCQAKQINSTLFCPCCHWRHTSLRLATAVLTSCSNSSEAEII